MLERWDCRRPKMAKKAANLFANKSTAVLTNVPSPRQPLYYGREKITNMMFWVPRAGRVGLGISVFSYDGKVTWGLATDAGWFLDPESILEGFEEDFNYLVELVKSGKVFPEIRWSSTTAIRKRMKRKPARHPRKTFPSTEAFAKSGRPCQKNAAPGSDYCHIHQNYKAAEKDEEPVPKPYQMPPDMRSNARAQESDML